MGGESSFNPIDGESEGSTGKYSGGGNSVYNKTHKLGEEIEFKKIIIKDSEIIEGTAKIYFFPKGNTSGGEIYIVNNKGKMFSIKLDTITGRVKVEKEEDDFYR